MAQIWNPEAYAQNGAFVHELAGGVLEWLAARPGEQVLDLGCGDGQLTMRIAAAGAEVRGVDASPAMVAAARSRGVQVEAGSADRLPYAGQSFDAVFSNAVLHWVRDQDAMLAEVHRVLKPGGRFVAEMGGFGNIAAIRVAFLAVAARHGIAGDNNCYPTPGEYARRLRQHGFEVRQIALIPRPTPLAESGMAGWLRTFRIGALASLPEAAREAVIEETVALLAPVLRDREGQWAADYVRLRFMATA